MNNCLRLLLVALLILGFSNLGINFVHAIAPFDNDYNSEQLKESVENTLNVDFGPYMREMQRRIKYNWEPIDSNQSNSVVLKYQIKKDGRLGNYNVEKSSGNKLVDESAVNALEKSAPFRPLPPDFKGDFIEVQFTFDYNAHKK